MTIRKPPQWGELARNLQDLYLTLLWEDGYSEAAIADFLGTTKGTIVRRRQSHLSLAPRIPNRRPQVDLERFNDLVDLHDMRTMEERGVAAIAPVDSPGTEPEPEPRKNRVRPKLAASEATQCVYIDLGGHRCAYEWTDSRTRRCPLHSR